MRDEIIVYCKDGEDIRETYDYIIKTNEFKPIYINKDRGEFINNKNNKRIRCFALSQNLRGLKAFVGLITERMKEYLINNEDVLDMIGVSIGDFRGYGINYSRSLIAPLSMLEKIIRNDITYVLASDYSDLEYKTNDVVSALGYLESNPEYLLCIGKQSNSKCEVIANLDINKERNYEEIVKIISELKI